MERVDPVEESVRAALQVPDEPVDLAPAIRAVLAEGRRAQRRRRVITTVGAVAVALVVSSGAVLGAVLIDQGSDGADGPVVGDHSPVEPGSGEPPFTWAARLPTSARAPVPLLAGNTLVVAGRLIDLPGTDAGLVGTTRRGTAVLIEDDPGEGTGEFSSYYALVGRDGSLTKLPPFSGQTQNALVSPDGSQIAYGSAVVDVASLQKVADLPPETSVLLGWTSRGIDFEASGRYYRYTRGGVTTELSGDPGDHTSGGTETVRSDGPCSEVVRSRGSEVDVVFRRCAGPQLLAVSPDGRVAVDQRLGLVVIPSGRTRNLPDAAGLAAVDPQTPIVWSSDSVFTTSLEDATTSGSSVSYVVTCDLDDDTCIRLADPLRTAEYDVVQLAR